MLEIAGIRIVARSRWYETAPVPASDQPWFVNGVAQVETSLDPVALLAELHRIEADLGRVRGARNAARAADLDLLAYGLLVRTEAAPLLPHPRLIGRAFVLLPLAEILPTWHHPALYRSVSDLIGDLPSDQVARPIA